MRKSILGNGFLTCEATSIAIDDFGYGSCGHQHGAVYLVPALAVALCGHCVEQFEEQAKVTPEDIAVEKRRMAEIGDA